MAGSIKHLVNKASVIRCVIYKAIVSLKPVNEKFTERRPRVNNYKWRSQFSMLQHCLPSSYHFLQSAIPCVRIWAVCLSRLNNVRRLSEFVSLLKAAISKDVIKKMIRKLQTKGILQIRQGGHRPAVTDNAAPKVRRRILDSLAKSLRRLSQEMGMSYSSWSAVGNGKIHRHNVTVVQELQPSGMYRRVASCQWFKTFIVHHG
jgi:hypothetical protein